MTIDNYEKLMDLHKEKVRTITKMVDEFLASYRSRSNKENADAIMAFEKTLDSYEKESKELRFETPFVETQREFVPVMKKLAGID